MYSVSIFKHEARLYILCPYLYRLNTAEDQIINTQGAQQNTDKWQYEKYFKIKNSTDINGQLQFHKSKRRINIS